MALAITPECPPRYSAKQAQALRVVQATCEDPHIAAGHDHLISIERVFAQSIVQVIAQAQLQVDNVITMQRHQVFLHVDDVDVVTRWIHVANGMKSTRMT